MEMEQRTSQLVVCKSFELREIPKDDGSMRMLGIPTVKDRMIQNQSDTHNNLRGTV